MSRSLCMRIAGLLLLLSMQVTAADPPVSDATSVAEQKAEAERVAGIVQADKLQQRVKTLTESIKLQPQEISLFSQRGDANFFLGNIAAAVDDYSRMTELDAEVDSSHWRRGIALFYAGKFDEAAGQFKRYHFFDNVDRENGIWRFLSQTKAVGLKKAQEGLLVYEKDDREPFPDVYQLFAGTISPEELLQKIEKASITDAEQEQRLFYAHLYIGLHASVTGQKEQALKSLELSVQNSWGPRGGYGPSYMWHVGRIHANLLRKELEQPPAASPAPSETAPPTID